MIKKLLLIITCLIFFTSHSALSQEIYKITSVNFDTSGSLIFLTSPDDTSTSIMKQVKLTNLQNPKRVYFDIPSAQLMSASQNWYLKSGGGIKQVKIAQLSTNPMVVRVVLYLSNSYSPTKIKFYKVNNNIVIKLKENLCKEEYFQNIYKDEHSTSSSYYENLSISNEDFDKINKAANDYDVLKQINQSFSSPEPVKNNVLVKELKLKSRYYINSITVKENGFLVSGLGIATIEKPMYLTNPSRVVFDVQNTIVAPDILNKDFKNNADTIRVGQYGTNKSRIVITTPDLEKYLPAFSSDGQSIFFTKNSSTDLSLFDKTNDATAYYINKKGNSDEFAITFNSPVVVGVMRNLSKLDVIFYNTLRYNENDFKRVVSTSNFADMKLALLPKVGLKLTLPLEKTSLLDCYLGADGKSFKIAAKGIIASNKISQSKSNVNLSSGTKIVKPYKRSGKHLVVLDAGHGGTDYGAIREGVREKDINLDMVKRVQAILEKNGVGVILTRSTDDFITLQDRTIITQNANADIFVSIHVNASAKPEIYGIETHYYHPESMDLANTIHPKMISAVKSYDRGLFKSKFYVINHTDIPAVLLEIGFISNEQERVELLGSKRKQQTAKAIADGIINYLKN